MSGKRTNEIYEKIRSNRLKSSDTASDEPQTTRSTFSLHTRNASKKRHVHNINRVRKTFYVSNVWIEIEKYETESLESVP